jgi:hypothetical protein
MGGFVRAVAAVLGPTTGPKPPLPQSSGIGHASEKLDLNYRSNEASSHQIKTALTILGRPSRSLRNDKEQRAFCHLPLFATAPSAKFGALPSIAT